MTGTGEIVTPALLRGWPLPGPGSGKESRGHLVVLGGGLSTPGAVRLAGEAALRAGAGKLAIATARSAATALAVAVPEAQVVRLPEDDSGCITTDAARLVLDRVESADVLLAGPGFDDAARASELLEALLPHVSLPVVLDALGTAYLTDHRDGLAHLGGSAVVTANPRELARMTGRDDDDVEDDPVGAAGELAQEGRFVVLLGGEEKHVVAPDGRSWVVQGGNRGLGVSGSGDVQAGIVAGLLARGCEPAQAAVWGGYLHARAGERLAGSVGSIGYLARELPEALPAVLTELG